MGLEVPDGDPVRTYTDEERRRLSANLDAVLADVYSAVRTPISIEFVRRIHAKLFEGVRDHAGRHRSSTFGSERRVFGPVRSVPRHDVAKRLTKLLEHAERVLTVDFNELIAPSEPHRVLAAIRLIATVHAEFIAIHPFEDGNGRTGRALMSSMLIRVGLQPIPIEASKHDYYLVLNEYHERQDIEPLVDFLVRLSLKRPPI